MTTTLTTKNDTHRPTRFNEDLFRKETYCHNHWWAGDYCYYGAHYLNEDPEEVKEIELAVPQPEEQPVAGSTSAVHDGFYTVSLPGDKHRTFRLQTQDPNASFAPGKQIIGFLSGSDNTRDYVNFAFIVNGETKLWRRFTHGYEMVIGAAAYLLSGNHADEAGKMYAQESGNCYICNRTLTTLESLAAGIGPTCASKVA